MKSLKKSGVLWGLAAVVIAAAPSAGRSDNPQWLAREGKHYAQRVAVSVENPLDGQRKGVPVTLAISEIRKLAAAFPGRSVVVVDAEAAPAWPWMQDAIVESQLDDTDGDGQADELTFLATLGSRQKKRYFIYFTQDDLPAPQFARRTQITPFPADPNAYFAIESDLFMFRFAREAAGKSNVVGDMFAKHAPGYTQHLYGKELWDYMKDSAVGRCILHPWDFPGQPGMGAILANTARGFEGPSNARVTSRIVSNGPIRSIGKIEWAGWTVDGQASAATAVCSMYAGTRYLQYDVTIRPEAGQLPDVPLCLGLPKLDSQTKEIDAAAGTALFWGDRRKLRLDGVGMGIVVPPERIAAVREFDLGHAVVLKTPAQPREALRVRAYLVGAWKGADSCQDAAQFFHAHRQLARELLAPPRWTILGLEARPAQAEARAASVPEKLFLANPSNLRSVLPAELDLGAWGCHGGEKTGHSEGKPVDMVQVYGTTKAFIECAIEPLKTATVDFRLDQKKASPGVAVNVRDTKSGPQIEVATGRARWLVDGAGLRKVGIGGKELLLEPSVQGGSASVLYSGAILTIVRIAHARGFVDYYFFKDRDIVKVASSQACLLSNPKLRSCVAKKELGVDGCEQYEVNSWGRVATDAVFQSAVVRYPAEWGALYSEESKCALVVYGSPSATRLNVKRGRIEAPLAAGCQRQEFYLAVTEDPASGEERFPQMASPIVLCRCGDGFAAREDRNGNGIADVVYVRDENGNGLPDFDGDRWYFDVDADGTLQMVLAFQASPRSMRVYCDTVTGGPLHSNNLAAYFGDYPTERYRFARYPKSREQFDGCLSPWELQEPFHIYSDLDGDGLFFKGPVTEGGFVARGRVTSAWGGPYLYEFFARNATLECTDLDGDNDADIWSITWSLQNLARDVSLVHRSGWEDWYRRREGKPDRAVFLSHFDLSDNNLEPVTVVSPYTGRAYWATRYYSMLLADNGKTFQEGRLEDGVIVGGQNWPAVGTWDVDNDGLAEGHIFVEYQTTLGMDLEKRRTRDDPAVRDRHAFQRDVFYEEQVLPCNFGMLCEFVERKQSRPTGRFFPPSLFPLREYRDPQGKKVVISAPFLPEQWHGERLPCRPLADGQYDYIANSNWDWFLKRRSPFVEVHHWRPGLSRLGHEGVWDQMYFNPHTRVEIAADGASSFALYYSPVIGGLHFRGLTFGLQFMHDREPHEAVARFERLYFDSSKGGPLFVGEYMHPRELCNDYPSEVRQYGTMLLYYRDRDRDGYVDTYLLDDDNDGVFEKRIWLDPKTSTVGIYDRGQMAFLARRIESVERELSLKNYQALVEMYHKGRESTGWLKTLAVRDGKVENAANEVALVLPEEWLPQVMLDAAHCGTPVAGGPRKNLWGDFGPTGLDTLARVASESAVHLGVLDGPYTPARLSGCNVLVITQMTLRPTQEETRALADWIEKGGTALLILTGDDGKERSPLAGLLSRFGLSAEPTPPMKILPGAADLSAVRATMKDSTGGTFLKDVAPLVFTADWLIKGKGARPLVESAGTPIIVEKQVGEGRVIAVACDLFENQRMRLPRKMRVQPFKPGNQSLAAGLIAYLVGKQEPKVEFLGGNGSGAKIRVRGKGGSVHFSAPWKAATVRVNGRQPAAEMQGGRLTVRLAAGETTIDVAAIRPQTR